MEFAVKRNDLLGELNLVQGVIEKKSTIPILSNILLDAAAGSLGITATDLDLSICCGCAADVKEGGTMTVSARRLFDIVRLLPDEAEIRFSLMENDWVEVKAGNAEYKVVGLPKENFPSIPAPLPALVSIPGAVLRGMIQRTIFAITQEESRYSLNGALMMIGATEIRMVATDGHRLALVTHPLEAPGLDVELRAIVPRKALVEVMKLIAEREVSVEFARDENHLFFSAGDKRLVSRTLAGQFPNYEMVIPRDNDKEIVASNRILVDAIRRTKVMADEKLKAIRLAFSAACLELTASSAEAGEAREVVPVEYDGPAIEIGFNPDYLLDFLDKCGAETISISVRDGDTQGMLRPHAASPMSYTYVVMPMKF
jgi:DNA polymerase III subunit beta